MFWNKRKKLEREQKREQELQRQREIIDKYFEVDREVIWLGHKWYMTGYWIFDGPNGVQIVIERINEVDGKRDSTSLVEKQFVGLRTGRKLL